MGMSKKERDAVYRAINEIDRVQRFINDDKTQVLRRYSIQCLPENMFTNKDGSFIGLSIDKNFGSELRYLDCARRELQKIVS